MFYTFRLQFLLVLLSLLPVCWPWRFHFSILGLSERYAVSSTAIQAIGNSFLGKAEEPFEVFRSRVAVDYGPRLIGGNIMEVS
jgi:hypothetical protein